MPVISIAAFGGLKPIQDAVLLKSTDATVATNARLLSGALTALKGTTILKALTKTAPQTIWRYGNDATETNWWLEFLSDTDVIRSPVVGDVWARTYWADGGTAKYGPSSLVLSGASYPGGSYTLGVPKPASAAAITSFTAPPDAANTESRSYVYTYVSAYDEEGPPSDASAVVALNPNNSVTVSMPSTGPGGSYNIAYKNIYRTASSGTNVEYQFVAKVAVATTSYVDTVTSANLGEVLPSTYWTPPPTGLKGLKLLANGAAIGFVDNTAYLSEPNLPHAWPHSYPIDAPIVGIGVFRQSAVLLTNSYPYLLSGADPSAMSPERMELPQACVSKRSIVDTGDGVLYASPDGLVSISSGGVKIVTLELLTREQWQAYNPSSMVAAVHDNRYHVLYQTVGGTRGMLIFDFSGQGAPLAECSINSVTAVNALYADPRTDTLYMAQGTNIVRFNAGSALTYTWRSKTFRAEVPCNYGCAQVLATSYPVTFKAYADGVLKHTQTVADTNVFRLPSGFRARDWQFELSGTPDVSQLNVAHAMSELKQI